MRRYLVFILALLIPIRVYAGCGETYQSVSPVASPQDGGWLYYLDGYEQTFCVDPDRLDPDYVNYYCSADMSRTDERAFVGVYRMYLAFGRDYFPARKAMRALTLRINGSGGSIAGEGNRAALYYCGGACAAGLSDCNSGSCQNLLRNVQTRWLTKGLSDFKINLKETGKDFEHTEGIYTFEAYGNGYNNILAMMDSKTGFGNMDASLRVTGCRVSDSRFRCTLIGGGKDLLDENIQQVKLTTSSLITSATDVNVTVNYRLDFPFAAAGDGLTIYACDGNDCTHKAAGVATQRLVVMDEVPVQSVSVRVKTTVPPACRTEGSGPNKKYIIGNREVTLVDYLKAGCCKDVDVEDVEKSNPAIDAYRDACLKDDKVNFQLECGTKSVVKNNLNKVGNESYNSNICTNEAYSDYTHSYIWQMGINRVLRQLEIKEKGAYMYNLNGVYGDNIASYTDTAYTTTALTGKNGTYVAPVSSGNNYCMLLISEVDDMYFPGTTIATSGRFFVFNELNKQECINSEEPGANCFRQPHIDGRINVAFHTNYDKWERDYLTAIDREKDARSSGGYEYRIAQAERQTLETYKRECENHRDIVNLWDYNLNPSLKFGFKQKIYASKEKMDSITEEVDMEISNKSVRYWPRISTVPSCKNAGGSRSLKNITRADGSTFTVDTTSNYFADCTRNVYYRPQKATYAALSSNQYKLVDESFQSEAQLIENGLKVGYVYNVRLTAYEGTFSNYFVPGNLGHTSKNGQNNVQPIMNKYSSSIGKQLSTECFYCNDYGEFDRVCDTCPDPVPDLQPVYIYRTIALSDVTPNNREETNWADAKGLAAKALIQASAGEKIVQSTGNELDDTKTLTPYKPVILGEASNDNELTVEKLRGKDIYNDDTEEFLEYELDLSADDMQIIRENTRRDDFSYAEFTVCSARFATVSSKSRNANYCFTCNADGKECASTFIDAFAKTSVTAKTRSSKWKYFIDGKWVTGQMRNISAFKDGRYPDPTNQAKWLENHLNWP